MEDLVREIEIAFIKKLMRLIQDKVIPVDQARLIARHFIALFPFHDVADIKAKVAQFLTLQTQFEEMNFVLTKWDDEEKTRAVIDKMREHIKAGEVDKAIAVADIKT